MPKRKCVFREEFSREWPFIRKGRFACEAECVLCQCFIGIGNGGRALIVRHLDTTKHRTSSAQSSSDSLVISCNSPCENGSSSSSENASAAAELALSYHTVKHRMSFRSMDCTNKLISKLLGESSSLANNFSCARTKTEAIITSVLGPNSVNMVKDELDQVRFFGLGTEACVVHEAQTVYPLVVQYFTVKDGICVKLLNLSCENPDEIADYCASSLERHQIDKEKCVAFSGDHANTKPGRLRGRGNEDVNIINRLKSSLHENIIGISCPGHILHLSMKTAADTLSLDVEMIVIKLIDYFCVYAIQDERLKEFCWFASTQRKNIQLYSKSVWSTLFPAIQMILRLFQPLKCFFLRQKCCPRMLVSFFENPLGEVYLCFLIGQLSLFEKQIQKLEGASLSVIEIESVLDDTQLIIQERLQQKFVSSSTQKLLQKNAVDKIQVEKFYDEVTTFYSICFDYLQRWLRPMKDVALFRWMNLSDPPEWNHVGKCAQFVISKGREINTPTLFDEFTVFKKLIEAEVGKEGWNVSRSHEKWVRLLRLCKSEEQYAEMFKLCEFIFSIPGRNANVEQLFNEMNKWTDERNRMKITTLEAILQCSFNYNMSCTAFYSHIIADKELLQRVKSSNKYL